MSIKPLWQKLINVEQNKAYFQSLMNNVDKQRKAGITIFPPENEVLNAFESVDIPDVKVVILGQDPYHGEGQAHGLAFSVLPNIKIPPSLVNIYKELSTDIENFISPKHGCLDSWSKQGVLLLNTVLTVQQANAHSHAKLGWETFTDAVISELNDKNDHCVFIFWGAHARKKGRNIDSDKHLVLSGPHPSPLSSYRGFFGSKPFSQANQWLRNQGEDIIDWRINEK
ncbi:MAG: uracil-DNA glycosylase [Colwellia sp.]|nr:uracil-DNA glycosylase [Colwellia sp.]